MSKPTRSDELQVGFRRLKPCSIKGPRTRHVVTFNPNKANGGEKIRIYIPKLDADSCIVPDSVYLLFDFKNKNTKSWFNQNLGRLLMKELRITVHNETIYTNTAESMLGVYRDLWLPDKIRKNMVEDGIGSSYVRKKISKDDESNDGADVTKMFEIYGTKQRIKLGQVLRDHGLYTAYDLAAGFMYEITLPRGEEIMTAQSSQKVEGYSLENIQLEYETITNAVIADQIRASYQAGRSLSYEHSDRIKTLKWKKESTHENVTINVPRKSMRAVVLFFKKASPSGSEEYTYPNIESVNVSIEGKPNMIYSQGIPKRRLFEESQRLFEPHDESPEMTYDDFYRGNKFAFVLDLRSLCDNDVTGNGVRLLDTQAGIQLEIKKKATTEDLWCHVFTLSDALVTIMDGQAVTVSY